MNIPGKWNNPTNESPASLDDVLALPSPSLTQARKYISRRLASGGIPDPGLEADILLCRVAGVSRLHLHLTPDAPLGDQQRKFLRQCLARRLDREPLAYILASCQFYGLEFYIDRRVLIPRPETELLVEKGIQFAHRLIKQKGSPLAIADIGTGCGCIATALALNLPHARVYAVDISPQALEVADINRHRHAVAGRVQLLQGDLTQPLPERVDLLLANLPYIRHGQIAHLAPEIRCFEPTVAVDGGDDGLDSIRRLLEVAPARLREKAAILLEVGAGQASAMMRLARGIFQAPQCACYRDLSGLERVVAIETGCLEARYVPYTNLVAGRAS